MPKTQYLLAVNGGSSSLKIAVYESGSKPKPIATVSVSNIGKGGSQLTHSTQTSASNSTEVEAATQVAAMELALNKLGGGYSEVDMVGIGHRVVHGGPDYFQSQVVTDTILKELRRLEPFDPEHLPAQVSLIEYCGKRFSHVPQVVCFDTAFHHDLPAVSRRLAIPRKFDALGVRRYGFHGLSYTFLMSELNRVNPTAANGKVVLAHLGSGASLAAVFEGKSIDTSMAFTPAAGIPMATRSGDIDPGLMDYLSREARLSLENLNRMVHLESGLLGISETTSDMRELLEIKGADPRAEEAVALYCYQVRKWIGAYSAALGGIDLLVFAGGIGERSPEVRRRICENLAFLGVVLEPKLNEANAAIISSEAASTEVRVIETDEEAVIANEVRAVIT